MHLVELIFFIKNNISNEKLKLYIEQFYKCNGI